MERVIDSVLNDNHRLKFDDYYLPFGKVIICTYCYCDSAGHADPFTVKLDVQN